VWYGVQVDLAFDVSDLMVEPEDPRIGARESFSFLNLPATAVVEGDTWDSDWGLNEPALRGSMTVTATSVGDDEIRVSFDGWGEGFHKIDRQFRAAYGLRTAAATSRTAVIDTATGWLRSVVADIAAEGTIEVTTTGFWDGIRPLAGSSERDIGVEMPTTYTIRIEIRAVEG